eukprot:m.16997 g.16997  ORF g.16997 m.16997 type:complete len:64 (+) comp27264_c0_seq1:67-258(+)
MVAVVALHIALAANRRDPEVTAAWALLLQEAVAQETPRKERSDLWQCRADENLFGFRWRRRVS